LSHGHPRDAMTLSRPPSIPLIAIGDVRGTDANWERFLASTSNSCLRSAVEWDATVWFGSQRGLAEPETLIPPSGIKS
jgi:hypothetical protein